MQQFGPWAFAGMVAIISYAAVQTFAPQYANNYLLLLLLSIILFYFARKGAHS